MLKQTFLAATKPFPAPILISQTFFPCSSYLLQAVYSYTNNSKSVDRWSHTSFTDLVLVHRQRMFSDAAIQVKKIKQNTSILRNIHRLWHHTSANVLIVKNNGIYTQAKTLVILVIAAAGVISS